MTEEEILQILDRRDREQMERTKALLLEEGRSDLWDELQAKLKDIRSGLDGAGRTWYSISEAQRRALHYAWEFGGKLVREAANCWWKEGEEFNLHHPIRLKTVRNLIARELLACDGGAFDPEKVLVLTERGRFVLKHGPEQAAKI